MLSLFGKGATHPLAARRHFYDGFPVDGTYTIEADVEIVGDLIGCTVPNAMDISMSAYNWKAGATLWSELVWVSTEEACMHAELAD